MRQYYDDYEDSEYRDYPALSRLRREQRREEHRFAARRKPWRRTADYVDPEDYESFNDYKEFTSST